MEELQSEVCGISDADKLAQDGEAFLKSGEWGKAAESYRKLSGGFPEDYRGWWGLVRAATRNLTWNPLTPQVKNFFAKALKRADPEKGLPIKQQFEDAEKNFRAKLDKFRTGALVREKSCESVIYIKEDKENDYRGSTAFESYYLTDLGNFIDGVSEKRHNDGKIIGKTKPVKEEAECKVIMEDGTFYIDVMCCALLYITDDYRKFAVDIYSDSLTASASGNFQEYETDFENHVMSYSVNVNSDSNKNCYIATAVYGDHDAPQVVSLRRFRDEVLLKSKAGQKFTAFYYKHSPRFAEKLKHHKHTNRLVRFALDGVVKLLDM